jgi:GNAT superfamily N-acetyltransferase
MVRYPTLLITNVRLLIHLAKRDLIPHPLYQPSYYILISAYISQDYLERQIVVSKMPEQTANMSQTKHDVEYDIKPLSGSEEDLGKVWQMWQTIFPAWPIERERMDKLLTLLPGHHHIHDAGFCLSFLEGTHGQIAAVGVVPEYRRKGLGSALLAKAHDELRSAARANGSELESLELGSRTPRFWAQMPADFPQEVKDFFIHRGNATETRRDILT